jgi:hypothetical protein
MDEHRVEAVEDRLRRVLGTLDDIQVPALPSLGARERATASPWMRAPAALATTLALVVIALVLGDRLNAWRSDRATSAPVASASSDVARPSASSAPRPAAIEIALPAEFEPRLSLVSPDGRYVAAVARDYGTVRLYRLGALMPGTVSPQLQQIAEIRGFAYAPGEVSWVEDSSAVVVQSDLVPGHTLQNRDANPAFRVVILNTDGRVVTAPAEVTTNVVTSYPLRRAPLSPDGRWLAIRDGGRAGMVRLLARSGLEVKTVVAAPTDGSTAYFFGWDGDGYLLYQQSWSDRSVITALEADGSVRYRVPADVALGGALWGSVATAPDRSWRVVQFGYGIGSDFRAYRLLVGSELRALPPEIERVAFMTGVYARGSEIVYRTPAGAMRAYDVRSGATRTLGLVAAPNAQPGDPTTIGVIDRYYVWMELIKGFVGDLETGATVELPLPRQLNLDRLDGPYLAVHRSDAIVVIDLAEWLR